MDRRIVYFETPGPENTEATLRLVRERVRELGIKTVVLASSHGGTANQAVEVFKGDHVSLIAVTICAGYTSEGWTMDDATRRQLQEAGVCVLTGIHALGDDVSGVFDKAAPNSIVAQTLYRFSQGMKVCVEVALMAADAGLVDSGSEIAAVAGTDSGADTAIILQPACTRKFRELKIHEILAMPR